MVLIIAGIIIMLAALMNSLLMGIEKFFMVSQGILLIGVALLQFIPSLLTFLPREGFLYAGMVIVIGAIGLLYGLMGMG